MFISLTPLQTGRTVRSDSVMTGEISLRGSVLPIGGVKENVLAAVRAGIAAAMLPERKKKYVEGIPSDAWQRARSVCMRPVDDAFTAALEPPKGK
jgi:ATP-dependent Lon protease